MKKILCFLAFWAMGTSFVSSQVSYYDMRVSSVSTSSSTASPNQTMEFSFEYSGSFIIPSNTTPLVSVTASYYYKGSGKNYVLQKSEAIKSNWTCYNYGRGYDYCSTRDSRKFSILVPENEVQKEGRVKVVLSSSYNKSDTKEHSEESSSFAIEYPNLYVDSISLGTLFATSPTTYEVEVSTSVGNDGGNFNNSSLTLFYYYCTQEFVDTSCIPATPSSKNSTAITILSSSSTIVTEKIVIPNDSQKAKYLRVKVQSNVVKESDTSDNDDYQEILFSQASKIDLAFTRFVVKNATTDPEILAHGQSVVLEYSVENKGTSDFYGNNDFCFYISSDSTFDATTDTYLDILSLTGMSVPAGQTITVSYTGYIDSNISVGTWYFFVKLNCKNTYVDSNSTNNVIAISPTIQIVECKSGTRSCSPILSDTSNTHCTWSQTCTNHQWGPCAIQPNKVAEVCDGKDNDCDGQVDEGLDIECSTDCGKGKQQCISGQMSECSAAKPQLEVCDGKDNDCDGKIDEDFDKDGDGYTTCGLSYNGTLTGPDGSAITADSKWVDCNDADSSVYPKAIEVCDGKDNDCNGSIDDTSVACLCVNGQTQACGQDTGECQRGTQTCSNGAWSSCVGSIEATQETCDGKDNDCDGQVDEDFGNLGKECVVGIGECKAKGIYQCSSNGLVTECSAVSNSPQPEVCDGKDNDCDGTIDENLSQNCYSGSANTANVGVCKKGIQICNNGQWSTCSGEVLPSAEVCDGKDNDCDGQVDNNVASACNCNNGSSRECGSSIGTCKKGIQSCSGGQWSACSGEVLPQKEICDGKDNDCDGKVDEDWAELNQPCFVGLGICKKQGTWNCSQDQSSVVCNAVAGEKKTEECNNLDDDCDGQVDQGLTKSCYSGPSGTQNVGTCKAGQQICQQGQWSNCQGEVKPQDETCDGKDNNCNGQIDEKITKECFTGNASQAGIGTCQKGIQTCNNGSWDVCVGETLPSVEICDGKDNDCDGQIDNTTSPCTCKQGETRSCGSGVGECKEGTQKCVQGVWETSCNGEKKPSKEICDGKDNDCDGAVDEDFSSLQQDCYVGQGECENKGKYICDPKDSSKVVCSQIAGAPQKEVCDGKDNDCDGKIDEDGNNQNLQELCYSGNAKEIGKGSCQQGIRTCTQGVFGDCVGEVKPSKEICDGKDNDCDGQVDNSPLCGVENQQEIVAQEKGTLDSGLVDDTIREGLKENSEESGKEKLKVVFPEVNEKFSGCSCEAPLSSFPKEWVLFSLFFLGILLRKRSRT